MTPQQQADEIAELIGTRLGIGGRGLETKIRRAGRLLPRRIRHEAEQLAEAARLAGHPRLARLMQIEDQTRAYRDCKRFLENIDGSERFLRYLLGFVTANAFNVLMLGGAVIAVLVWRGYL